MTVERTILHDTTVVDVRDGSTRPGVDITIDDGRIISITPSSDDHHPGVAVVDAYGLSETWGGFVLDGHPIAGAEVSLGPNHEIRVRGPMVLRGYRLDLDTTRAAVETLLDSAHL